MTADLFGLEQSTPQALRIMLLGCWLATDCRVVLALRRGCDSWTPVPGGEGETWGLKTA